MVEILETCSAPFRTCEETNIPPQINGVEFRHRRRLREMIEVSVARAFGVAKRELRTPTRGPQQVALARQVAMYVAHVSCGLTLTEVGMVFARDRTTVAHACSVIEDRRDDETFDYVLELLERVAMSNIGPRQLPTMMNTRGTSA